MITFTKPTRTVEEESALRIARLIDSIIYPEFCFEVETCNSCILSGYINHKDDYVIYVEFGLKELSKFNGNTLRDMMICIDLLFDDIRLIGLDNQTGLFNDVNIYALNNLLLNRESIIVSKMNEEAK